MPMSDDANLEELKAQTSQGDRIDQEADQDRQHQLVDAFVDEMEAIDAGDQQKTVSLWDGNLAAFVRGLEANPEELQAVGHSLQRRFDIDESDVDRSEVLRLALRLGLQEAAPDQFEVLREAARKHATSDL